MKILVFEAKEKAKDGRHYIYGIPFHKITELRTIYGGHRVECRINGVETKCSFHDIVEAMGGEEIKVE